VRSGALHGLECDGRHAAWIAPRGSRCGGLREICRVEWRAAERAVPRVSQELSQQQEQPLPEVSTTGLRRRLVVVSGDVPRTNPRPLIPRH